jgi:hypothetical protein
MPCDARINNAAWRSNKSDDHTDQIGRDVSLSGRHSKMSEDGVNIVFHGINGFGAFASFGDKRSNDTPEQVYNPVCRIKGVSDQQNSLFGASTGP